MIIRIKRMSVFMPNQCWSRIKVLIQNFKNTKLFVVSVFQLVNR